MLSPDQIMKRCLRTDSRVTEWVLSDLLDPKLITAPKTNDGWPRAQSQLKGLQAVNAAGDPIDAPITSANATEFLGTGPDGNALARQAAQAAQAKPVAANRLLTNAEITRLSVDDLVRVCTGAQLKENVKVRSEQRNGKWLPRGVRFGGRDTAEILWQLVRTDGLEPKAGAGVGAAGGAAGAAAGAAADPGMMLS